jgi:hypothetical protein
MNRRELLTGIAVMPVAAIPMPKPRMLHLYGADGSHRDLVEGVDADFDAQWDAAFGTKLQLRDAIIA